MRFTKVLGLAAVAAMVAMAFIGASSASANVSLCKTLILNLNKCAAGEIAPSGTVLLGLAKDPILKNSIATVLCEDATVEAKTTSAGAATLPIEITKLEFGKLPTPKLGEGCTTCVGGVHTFPPYKAEIEAVTNGSTHDWFLKGKGEAELLNCFGLGITCAYGSETLKSLIDNDAGTHKNAPGEKGYALILVRETLKLIGSGTLSSAFCPSTGTWEADYVVYLVSSGGVDINAWLALS